MYVVTPMSGLIPPTHRRCGRRGALPHFAHLLTTIPCGGRYVEHEEDGSRWTARGVDRGRRRLGIGRSDRAAERGAMRRRDVAARHAQRRTPSGSGGVAEDDDDRGNRPARIATSVAVDPLDVLSEADLASDRAGHDVSP